MLVNISRRKDQRQERKRREEYCFLLCTTDSHRHGDLKRHRLMHYGFLASLVHFNGSPAQSVTGLKPWGQPALSSRRG